MNESDVIIYAVLGVMGVAALMGLALLIPYFERHVKIKPLMIAALVLGLIICITACGEEESNAHVKSRTESSITKPGKPNTENRYEN